MKDVGAPEGNNNAEDTDVKNNSEKISELNEGKIDPTDTAAQIAKETGVTDRTIRNDAKYTKAVDTVAAIHDNPTEAKSNILSGKTNISKKALEIVAEVAECGDHREHPFPLPGVFLAGGVGPMRCG